MKGLLYKDISIMTRSFKGNILLLVALYGVLILVTREAYLAYAMTVVWGIYVASTINYDEQAHWDAYAATLPVTPGQVIGSKYLLCAASTAIGAVLSLALVFLAGVGGAEYTLGILACAEVSVLMNALLMPITYRFGAAKSRASTRKRKNEKPALCFHTGRRFRLSQHYRGGCSHRPLQNERHHIISIPRSLAERSTRSASTPRAVLWWQCSLTSAHPHGPYSSP